MELVQDGTYAQVAELLWTGEWPEQAHLPAAALPDAVLTALRGLPAKAASHGRTAHRRVSLGRGQSTQLPTDGRAGARADRPRPIGTGRLRVDCARAREPVEPDPELQLAAGFLYQLTGETPDPAAARALDAYFITGAEHGFNASTFTARVITSTQSDLASAVVGAIGALKGPLHGGAPSEVVSQLHQIGSVEHAEKWIEDTLNRGERLMGFGHRVYRAYDPRAAALRAVAEGMGSMAEWLKLAVAVEDIALRKLAERHPDRALKTNVEFYAAAVLQGVGLPPDLFPATFALARHAGWTAHVLEQASANRLIRPDVRYVGPAERSLPAVAAVR